MGIKAISYNISFRDILYPRLEFKTGKLLLVLPRGSDPDEIMNKHKKWVADKMDFIERCRKAALKKEIVKRTDKEFYDLVYNYQKNYSIELKENLNRVFFRSMSTKWASCSSKRNLTINKKMQFLPGYLINYIILHEVTHLKHKRHNAGFWKIISSRFENYEELEKELFSYWFKLSEEKL
jgi:predicted metal-dependent hydrolase